MTRDEIRNAVIQLTIDRPKNKRSIYLDRDHEISVELNYLDDETYKSLLEELHDNYSIVVSYGWLSEYCISW